MRRHRARINSDPVARVLYLKEKAEETKRRRVKHADRLREYERIRSARRRQDASHRIRQSIAASMYYYLKVKKSGRHWETLVGYTMEQLKAHLEARFLPGMTWENWGQGAGKWNIDHVVPHAAFNYSSPDDEDFHRCWALSNLQPLWAEDNIRKLDKLPCDFQPTFALGA